MIDIISHLHFLDASAFACCGMLLWITINVINRQKRSSTISLPPGPKALPFLGNTLDMPRKDDHLVLSQWGKQYGESGSKYLCNVQTELNLVGDIVLVTLLGGRKVIYVNSAKAASELFEKRSRIYSDRPEFPFISERYVS